jgi:hypothetical protein
MHTSPALMKLLSSARRRNADNKTQARDALLKQRVTFIPVARYKWTCNSGPKVANDVRKTVILKI